jgi:hypothetical protein
VAQGVGPELKTLVLQKKTKIKNYKISWAWWHTSIIPELRKLGQDPEFEASMDYKKRKNNTTPKRHIHMQLYAICM